MTVLSRWKAQPQPHVSIAFSRTHHIVARPGDINQVQTFASNDGGKAIKQWTCKQRCAPALPTPIFHRPELRKSVGWKVYTLPLDLALYLGPEGHPLGFRCRRRVAITIILTQPCKIGHNVRHLPQSGPIGDLNTALGGLEADYFSSLQSLLRFFWQ
jgi:hypothetical protein